jgi:hypothetical protein
MNALLQVAHAHRRAAPIVALVGHIVFTTIAGQGWLAGPEPSLDALRDVSRAGSAIKPPAHAFFPGFDGLVDDLCY